MVTANRRNLARRAVKSFLNQSYPNKELIVVDDGKQDYSPLFYDIPPNNLRYIKLDSNNKTVLGKLRNIAVEAASGDYLTQWDDDDWYHPDRLLYQVEYLQKGYDACCLSASLMHLDDQEFFNMPYIGHLPEGIPGTIMHRRSDDIRYPALKLGEDTYYLKEWLRFRYTRLPSSYAGLFIRCFHGSNTWERQHFLRRLRNSPKSSFYFLYHKYVGRNLSGHPSFNLTKEQKKAFDLYLKESQELSLFKNY